MQHKRARALAHIFQAAAYQVIGELEVGISIYEQEIEKGIYMGHDYHAMYRVNLGFIYWMAGDLVNMRTIAERSLKFAMEHQLTELISFSLYFMGIACYQQNNLQIAEEKLTTLVKDFYFVNSGFHAHSSVALSLIYLAKGEIGLSRKICENLRNYAIDTNNQVALFIIRAFEAELALRQGRLLEASKWAANFNIKPFLLPFLFYLPQLTLIKILMAQDTTVSRQQAADILDQLHDFLVSVHNNQSLIHVLALQALLHQTCGEIPTALEKLSAALSLSEPGGFIRPFVDLGPRMADLLKQLIKQNIAVGYIKRIMDAFSEDEQHGLLSDSLHHGSLTPHRRSSASDIDLPPPTSTFHTSQPLVEPLTNRELEILVLLAQRMQNKEIGANLFISPKTVKKHLDNIYGKLNVSNRQQAVEKAETLGILSRR
jgi:LuxR family maltose regulon positive regulatory protein